MLWGAPTSASELPGRRPTFLLVLLVLFLVPTLLTAQTYGGNVSPQGGTAPNAMIHTTGNSFTFHIENTGNCDPIDILCTSFTFGCVGASNITCTNWPDGILIAPGSGEDVTVTFSTGNEGSGTLTLNVYHAGMSGPGFVTVPVVVPPGAPLMSVLPYLDAKQDMGRCAVSCFETVVWSLRTGT
jgi:hypothetical protein